MIKKAFIAPVSFGIALSFITGGTIMAYESTLRKDPIDIIKLPEPTYESKLSVESALRKRRSKRHYLNESLTLVEVSQLLWAAQGITGSDDERTAPSAGALYPLEVYLAVGNVQTLPKGIYKYRPHQHELVRVMEGDQQAKLTNAALWQSWVRESAAVVVFTAVYERTTQKYKQRGIRYVHMEVGHAAQNVYLQATSLNLGTVIVGAFNDEEVKRVMNLPEEEQPLCLMPVGKIR